MNRQVNIKTFVTLLIGVVVFLILGGPSVQAQTTDPAAPVESSITLTAKGTVSETTGSVTVTGIVTVTCKRVIDNTATIAKPLVLLDFDFSQLKGTTGSGKNVKTFVTGDNHTEEIRPLQASDTIIVTVPYYDSAVGPLSAKSLLATATLNFDVATGKLTSGSLTVGNNVITSAAVGTTTAIQ